LAETTNTIENGNCTNRVLAAGLSDLQRAEATVEFMNLFRQMLNEARFFSHDERSLRGYLIEDIEKKKLKAEELLNVSWLCVCYFGLQTLAFKDKFYSQNNSTKPLLVAGAVN